MATTKIPTITLEYFRVPVNLTVDGVTIDPTGLVVEWAVVPTGMTPIDTDWKTGSWEIIDTADPVVYLARCLVGTSDLSQTVDFELTQGQIYDAWMRVTDTPERPARLVGQIQAT